MKVSVIIPTYNRSHYICQTIDSFLKQDYPKADYEIIVCDNNSNDNTKEIVERYLNNSYGVKFIYLFEGRQGVHYARNSAAKVASNELLYFTDDDMIADQQLIKEIIKPFLFSNKVGTATGRVLPIWESKPPKWILKHFSNSYLSLLDPIEEFVITKQINYLYSCHQAIRKDVFFGSEGFNPEFTKGKYLGDGETGLNHKILQMGYQFGFNGASIIHHIIPSARMTQKYINRRFANGGISHAYTDYRTLQSTNIFIRGIIIRTFILCPIKMIKYLIKTILYRDKSFLHFIPAYISYYYSRLMYELRILFNKKWKKFVLKRDWLTNDNFEF